MPNLFTIGYTKKSAENFFGIISENKIEIVVQMLDFIILLSWQDLVKVRIYNIFLKKFAIVTT